MQEIILNSNNGRVHVERPARVLGVPGTSGHLQQGTAMPAHLLQEMPGGDHRAPQGASLPRMPNPCGLQNRRASAQRAAYEDPRGHAECSAQEAAAYCTNSQYHRFHSPQHSYSQHHAWHA